jgi:HEPN domain-containing protein
MTPHELALELLDLAAADEYVVHKLVDDPQASDSIIGFHSQQAAEKLLKAALIEKNLDFDRSHDLVYLADLLIQCGDPPGVRVEDLAALNPYAFTLRYENPMIRDTFDRGQAQSLVAQLRRWVEEHILGTETGNNQGSPS